MLTGVLLAGLILSTVHAGAQPIDRQALVERHNPAIDSLNPQSPFTLGNGHFAFTADVTGLQSFGDLYFSHGIPLETKARWAWHSRANPSGFSLQDVSRVYEAYGREVAFPTEMDSAAGQWLRQNPHDLPFLRLGLLLDGRTLSAPDMTAIRQELDMWRGLLESRYKLDGEPVSAKTVVHGRRDIVAVKLSSALLEQGRLAIRIRFPRGYDTTVKNTPDLDWRHEDQHSTVLVESGSGYAAFLRQVDDHRHRVILRWQPGFTLARVAAHEYRLQTDESAGAGSRSRSLEFNVEFVPVDKALESAQGFDAVEASAQGFWNRYWQSGAVLEVNGGADPRAAELERRVVLSQYLLAAQANASIPAQETGLTASSWYGKFHTEMTWWHNAHWILWGRPEPAEKVLAWYRNRLDSARRTAAKRGLQGARWSKMVGPEGRESPGGNPLIIWNQPQAIHLAEMLYQKTGDRELLAEYRTLVEETAQAMSSMLSWEEEKQRWSLLPPIWIAQEIYDPTRTVNPAFELAYWRYGLQTAQAWRDRLGLPGNESWRRQLARLAELPTKDGRYVAIESRPDTFDNPASRRDHPTMLAPYGVLHDATVDSKVMQKTLESVLASWDWEAQIWGWDYPMIAMTAIRLGDLNLAVDVLLKDAPHNHYSINGHCPQPGANLAVYLPANSALLSAVAMLLAHWPETADKPGWQLRSAGFR